MPQNNYNLTWTCHICGEERPDEKISVMVTDLSEEAGLEHGCIRQHTRYCNDRQDCRMKAKTYRHTR